MIADRSPFFIAGPTAVGKSAVALELARLVGGEIISADSMQVYRGMDIGTAKPSADERKRIRHHLVDILDLTERFDAAQFAKLARAAESEIQSRNKTPIYCGGTGLYFKALLSGVGSAPPGDSVLRAAIESEPLEKLLHELNEKDPAAYTSIDVQNSRRVVRAIEVIRLTGKPFSSQKSAWTAGDFEAPSAFFCLRRPPHELRQRTDRRVDEMFKLGLVEETRQLVKRGLAKNPTASQALGYRQVIEYFDGERDLQKTVELVRVRTRQFAKRQMTWFKHQLPAHWIDVGESDDLATIAARMIDSSTTLPTV